MNRFTLSRLAPGLLLAAVAVGAQAIEVTQVTDTVKGRAPEASSVGITNQTNPGVSPRVGSVLQVGYSFSDADGDDESGTAIQWLRNGNSISGATSATYTTQATDDGTNVSVQITPHTAASTTDPNSGTPVSSAALTVVAGAVAIGNFLAPDTARRNWTQANSYCQSLGNGARLPTQSELQQLFVNATSSPVFAPNSGFIQNAEMCSVYGWPLSGQCGGGRHNYWSNTSTGAGTHYSVALDTGTAYAAIDDAGAAQVVCTR